jgi:hypothetical protein
MDILIHPFIMNSSEDLIKLKFQDTTQTWKRETLENIPYFAVLFKEEWAKDRNEFNMEEDPAIFAMMVRKCKKHKRLIDINRMADYYGIEPSMISQNSAKNYKELSYKLSFDNNKYNKIDLSNLGKLASIYIYTDSCPIILIKLAKDNDEFIRTDKKFSKYLIKEINKINGKFWISVDYRLKSITHSHPMLIYIDVKYIHNKSSSE